MTSPEHELARKIAGHLDGGTRGLDPGIVQKLALARSNALARARTRPEPVFGLAWAGHAAAQVRHYGSQGGRQLMAVAVLLLALVGFAYWQALPSNDVAEIDVGLLTDDLPISAYLDKGFDSWLKRALR